MRHVKRIEANQQPGTQPRLQAQDVAIAQGWNCYSKPWGDPAFEDRKADGEEIFFFSKNLVVLEVVIKTVNENSSLLNKEVNT